MLRNTAVLESNQGDLEPIDTPGIDRPQ